MLQGKSEGKRPAEHEPRPGELVSRFDADDPMGVLLSVTLADDYSEEESAREPGPWIDSSTPTGQPLPPSPELTYFTAVTKNLPPPPSAGGPGAPQAAAVDLAARTAAAGRENLADHWTMLKGDLIATAAAQAADPQLRLRADAVRAWASTDGEMLGQLSQWRELRSAGSLDFAALSAVAVNFLQTHDTLTAALEKAVPSVSVNEPTDLTIEVLKEQLRAIRTQFAAEAETLAAGGRVPAAAPGEAIRLRLEATTADGRDLDKLLGKAKWVNIVATALRAVGKIQDKELSPRLTFDGPAITTAFNELDAALVARKNAKDPVKAQVTAYSAYEAAAYALHEQMRNIRSRSTDLASNSKDPGWTAAQCEQALAPLMVAARALRGDLANDSLRNSPDHSAEVASVLKDLDGLCGPTALESEANTARQEPRKSWRKARDRELAKFTRAGMDVSAFKKGGLGPLLDRWVNERAKFPQQDRQAMHDLALTIADVIRSYRSALTPLAAAAADPTKKATKLPKPDGMAHALDVVTAGIALDIRSYAARGGLFG